MSTTSTSARSDARLAKAMSNPIRLRLLAMFNEGVTTPKDLAERLGEPLENVAYHVRILKELGCIELVRTEPRRGAKAHFYRATTRAFVDSETSEELGLESRTAISSTILQECFRAAYEATALGTFDSRTDRHVSLTTFELTEEQWVDVNQRLDQLLEEALAMQAEAMASGEQTEKSELVIAHFPSARK